MAHLLEEESQHEPMVDRPDRLYNEVNKVGARLPAALNAMQDSNSRRRTEAVPR
jgi:hypothetical protein